MEATRNTDEPELRAWMDVLAAGQARGLGESLGLGVVGTAGGTALVASGIDNLLFNRAFARDPRGVEALGRIYEDQAIERYMITLPRGAAATGGPALGLERFHRTWITLMARPEPQTIDLDGFAIRTARPDDAEAVARLYCSGFDVPAVAVPILAGLIGRPRWHVYVAEGLEQPGRRIIGLGITYLERSHAYLFGGVTAPEHRRRGIQRALIGVRINHAHRCGATMVSTDTGEAIAGQPNHSQHNLERAGLRVVSAREHLVPCGTTRVRGGRR